MCVFEFSANLNTNSVGGRVHYIKAPLINKKLASIPITTIREIMLQPLIQRIDTPNIFQKNHEFNVMRFRSASSREFEQTFFLLEQFWLINRMRSAKYGLRDLASF